MEGYYGRERTFARIDRSAAEITSLDSMLQLVQGSIRIIGTLEPHLGNDRFEMVIQIQM